MDVQIRDPAIREQPLDQRLDVTSLDDVRIDHERIGIIGAERDHPEPKQLRYFPDGERRFRLAVGESGSSWAAL